MAGVRQTSHRSHTAKGESMLFLTLEGLRGTLDAVLFPDAYRTAKSLVPKMTFGNFQTRDEEEGREA